MKSIGVKWLLASFLVSATLLIHSCTRKEEKIFFQVSQSTVTVYGYVKDVFGNPVSDAEITILPTGDTIKSDKNGLYRFSIALGELPQDAVIYFKVSKSGFVPAQSSVSFAELIKGSNNDVAIQKRVKRQDVILYPPAQLKIEVVDEKNNPVTDAVVLVYPSPSIANYLGISSSEAVASSQTTPVSITDKIPAIDFVRLIAFPPEGPEGKEEVYSVSYAVADVSKIKANGKVVLKLQQLKIIYSSVDTGQFISPTTTITLVFSKEVTGFQGFLTCANPVEFEAKIDRAIVTIDPFGVLLGSCRLDVNGAFGKNGETLDRTYSWSFVAYDPAAPRGLACPTIMVNLPAFASNATGYSFDSIRANQVVVYSSAINYNGFIISPNNNLELIWDPVAINGIDTYIVKFISDVDKQKGTGRWQDTGATPEFRPSDRKWVASVNIGGFDISYGKKYYFAVVPVNINGEEVCNPETINSPFTVADNTGPRINNIVGWLPPPNYSTRVERNIQIQFSEPITGGTIEITSRTFNVVKISEVFTGTQARVDVFLEPVSVQIPDRPENNDGNEALLISADDARKLWVRERVTVYNASGTDQTNPLRITAIVPSEKVPSGSDIWFNANVVGVNGDKNFVNGFIVPVAGNSLQSPGGNLYVVNASDKILEVTAGISGLTVGDTIQVLNPITGLVKTLTINRVDDNTSRITVNEDISNLGCNSQNKQCTFRSLNPDIKIKANVYDTSGNPSASWADQSDQFGNIIW